MAETVTDVEPQVMNYITSRISYINMKFMNIGIRNTIYCFASNEIITIQRPDADKFHAIIKETIRVPLYTDVTIYNYMSATLVTTPEVIYLTEEEFSKTYEHNSDHKDRPATNTIAQPNQSFHQGQYLNQSLLKPRDYRIGNLHLRQLMLQLRLLLGLNQLSQLNHPQLHQ